MAGWYANASMSSRQQNNLTDKLRNIDLKGSIHFDYDVLKESTDGFNDEPLSKGGNKLGEGGFGPVFKGDLRKTNVAIKGISKRARGGMGDMVNDQFLTEVEVLSKFRHPNLVILLGCSVNGPVPYLVYEYLPNGTLEDAIEYKYEQGVRSIRLSWQMRQSIALDTARGLLYLHTADPDQPLVHRDVKSANVLLDSSYRAKVGDFGLARVLDGGSRGAKDVSGGKDRLTTREPSTTVNIIGTSGYIPKEYLEGIITPKMDVYAFGVILLELLSGLASFDSRRSIKDLTSFLRKELDEPKDFLAKRVDAEAGSWPSDAVIGIAEIAKRCLADHRDNRPEMEEVYDTLDEILVSSSRVSANLEEILEKEEKRKTHRM